MLAILSGLSESLPIHNLKSLLPDVSVLDHISSAHRQPESEIALPSGVSFDSSKPASSSAARGPPHQGRRISPSAENSVLFDELHGDMSSVSNAATFGLYPLRDNICASAFFSDRRRI